MEVSSIRIKHLMEKVIESNKESKIKIRLKNGARGISVFLDFFYNNKHNLYYYPNRIFGSKESEKKDELIIRYIFKDRDDKELTIISGKNPFKVVESPKDIEFLPYFIDMCDRRKDRPIYQSTLKHLKNFFKGKKYRFSDLTPRLFEDFKEFLFKNKISINTTIGYLDALRATLNKAVREKIITESPMKEVRLKVQPVIKEYLSPEDILSIINVETKYKETKNAFLFSCFTGMRKGDMSKLTFDEIRGDNIYFIQGKTKKEEFLPLSADALEIIKIQRELHPKTKKVFQVGSKTQIQRELKRILKDVGITRKVTYHSSRHTFAVRSLESGIDSHDVKNFMGHTKIETTEVYLKFATSQKRKVIDRVPSLMPKSNQ